MNDIEITAGNRANRGSAGLHQAISNQGSQAASLSQRT